MSPLKQHGEVLLVAGLVLLAAAFVPFVPILWLIAQVTLGFWLILQTNPVRTA